MLPLPIPDTAKGMGIANPTVAYILVALCNKVGTCPRGTKLCFLKPPELGHIVLFWAKSGSF